jgi:hypothetical protein
MEAVRGYTHAARGGRQRSEGYPRHSQPERMQIAPNGAHQRMAVNLGKGRTARHDGGHCPAAATGLAS